MRWACPARPGLGAINMDQIVDALTAGSRAIDPDLPEIVALVREIITMERRPGGLLDPTKP